MKKFNLIIISLVFLLLIHNASHAQYLNIFAGAKFPEFNTTNIQLAYVDESPDPDLFYANTSLKKEAYYTVGVSYDNYKHEKELYYNAIGNVQFGEIFGFEIGASLGYPVFISKTKKISIVPTVSGGFSYASKRLGELINNTVYIQVNSTKFADNTNVKVGLVKTDLFLKPSLNILWDLSSKYQLRVTGSYETDFNLKQFIEFSGKDNSGKAVSDKEDTDARNLSYNINGSKSNSIPLNIKGFEVKLGFAINFGKEKSEPVKQK
ncbi:MAG: hypothetical protein K1X86_14940 [Ignavibacteria bacterium]|nr:hypothetical protein [Ignavibacteria bacterium]